MNNKPFKVSTLFNFIDLRVSERRVSWNERGYSNSIYSHAGHIRDYNITKKEWVLDGATVLYGSATELKATLDYDF